VPWLGRLLGVPNVTSHKAAVYVARGENSFSEIFQSVFNAE